MPVFPSKNVDPLKCKTTIFAFVVLSLSAAYTWNNRSQKAYLEIGDRSVILLGKQGQLLFKQCSRPNPLLVEDFWSPTINEVEDLESVLPQTLSSQYFKSEDSLKSPSPSFINYYKQYAGFIRGGKKMIYLNAFSQPSTNWLEEAVVWCDGGIDSFGIVYDVAARHFEEFHFNGAMR